MPALARGVFAACLLAVVLPACGESPATQNLDPLDVVARSREAIGEHRPEHAVDLLNEALKEGDHVSPVVRGELLAWLGRARQAQGHYSMALESLAGALEIRDQSGACIDLGCVDLLADLGNVAMSAGDPDASLGYLQRALAVAKAVEGDDGAATARMWLLLGSAHMLRDENRLAERALRTAVDIGEERQQTVDDLLPTALINLAVTLRRLGRVAEATEMEQRGLELSNGRPQPSP